MNRVKTILEALMRSLPLRREDGLVAPYSIMVLVVILFALVGIGAHGTEKVVPSGRAR